MARRLLSRFLPRAVRRAGVAVCFVAGGAAAAAGTIVEASYGEPTSRYAHGILGDAIEWGTLELLVKDRAHKTKVKIKLPKDRVFEDVAPRLVDVDGDGQPEVVVVETQVNTGAQLAVYDETGKIAFTPHIGRSNRWLSPVGVADLDGDGFIELAYIDRPHLAKTLRIWRYRDGALEHVADQTGLTNHRIGEDDIGGGLRDCGGGIEMITASADWSRVIATGFEGGQFTMRDLGPHKGRASLNTALNCR